MKRDMELVRELLISIEEHTGEKGWSVPSDMEYLVVVKHLELMEQANLVNASIVRTKQYSTVMDASLTWDGHDYLNAIRNETVWNKVKENVKEKGIQLTELSFGMLKEYAVFEGKKILGLA
ncbi:MAG: DUF2513 domain-containing protein [Treponema sp.]|nr:DUF2513 domain-containing protein [Candidatus Treponema scatequi]